MARRKSGGPLRLSKKSRDFFDSLQKCRYFRAALRRKSPRSAPSTRGGRLPPRAPPPRHRRILFNRGFSTVSWPAGFPAGHSLFLAVLAAPLFFRSRGEELVYSLRHRRLAARRLPPRGKGQTHHGKQIILRLVILMPVQKRGKCRFKVVCVHYNHLTTILHD